MSLIANVESPYNAPNALGVRRNILYARLACRWALEHGYAPYASHLLYTQPGILDDDVAQEREMGIAAARELIRAAAQVTLMFVDLGVSEGMRLGLEDALAAAREVLEIRLFEGLDVSASSYDELLECAQAKGLLPGGYVRMGWG